MNIPSKVASSWFGDRERAVATAIGSVSVPIGSFISLILPSAFIKDEDTTNLPQGKNHFEFYLMVQTMVVTIFSVPALAFIKDEPPSPPSIVANETK